MKEMQLRRMIRNIIIESQDWQPNDDPSLEPVVYRLGELLAAAWNDFSALEEAILLGERNGLIRVQDRNPTHLDFEVAIEAYDVMANIYGPETSAPSLDLFDVWFEDRCGFGFVDRERGVVFYTLSSGDIPGWRS